MTSDARGYTPATRDDLLPGAVFVVMGNGALTEDGIGHCFPNGERVTWLYGDGTDNAAKFQGRDDIEQYISLHHLTPAPREPVTSHAAAAAEIARLRAEVAALREALRRWQHYGCPDCGGDCGSANPPVSCCIMQETQAALKGTQP